MLQFDQPTTGEPIFHQPPIASEGLTGPNKNSPIKLQGLLYIFFMPGELAMKISKTQNYPDTTAMGRLSFDIISVKRLSFQYFHVIGKWHLQRSIGDLSGHYTLLLKKINGRWVIIADHSS